ncbi:MAG TPA: DUF2934 domain-containing protein [Candidatus Sulfotelmatobacter sp.]|nr:DUF2934 domain-containing protein [Candidatus Sulfotelmatobacter sp.]
MESHDSPHPKLSPPPSRAALREMIRRRAEEIYVRGGRLPGRDLDNWAQAEAEILQEYGESMRRTAIVVDVNGVQYVGEYDLESGGGYQPGEFFGGEDIPVRFEGEKMFVRRPNGAELETTIVHKIG